MLHFTEVDSCDECIKDHCSNACGKSSPTFDVMCTSGRIKSKKDSCLLPVTISLHTCMHRDRPHNS